MKDPRAIINDRAQAGDTTCLMAFAILEVADALHALREMHTARPLHSQTFDGMTSAIESVAEAIRGATDE